MGSIVSVILLIVSVIIVRFVVVWGGGVVFVGSVSVFRVLKV